LRVIAANAKRCSVSAASLNLSSSDPITFVFLYTGTSVFPRISKEILQHVTICVYNMDSKSSTKSISYGPNLSDERLVRRGMDVDIKRALFPRTICGKHVVMYRQADGR